MHIPCLSPLTLKSSHKSSINVFRFTFSISPPSMSLLFLEISIKLTISSCILLLSLFILSKANFLKSLSLKSSSLIIWAYPEILVNGVFNSWVILLKNSVLVFSNVKTFSFSSFIFSICSSILFAILFTPQAKSPISSFELTFKFILKSPSPILLKEFFI